MATAESSVTAGVFVAAAVIALATADAARRKRRERAGGILVVQMLPIALWCLGAAVLLLPVSLTAQVIARACCYAGILGTATALVVLARAVTDPDWRPARWARRVLVLVPVLVLLTLLTNPWHGLFFVDVVTADPPRLHTSYGPLFWVHSAYCYGLCAWAVTVLLRARRTAPWYFKRQLTSLVLSALPPLFATVAAVVFAGPLQGIDYGPLGFVLTGLVISRALFSQGLLSVLPIARERVLEKLSDAVVVIDAGGRIVDMNDRAHRLAASLRPDLPADLCGRSAQELFPRVLRPLGPTGQSRTSVAVTDALHLDASTSLLHDRDDRELGRVVVLRDVSDDVARRRELESANRRLVAQQDELAAANALLSEQLQVNELLRARLSEDVVRDPLTGLHNRRRLETVLAEAQRRSGADTGPFSLVVVDVDHFKRVNDAHGHAVGDEVLKRVAGELLASCRSSDTVVRYGGEEFVVVLPGTSSAEACRRAEQLRARCAAAVVQVDPVAGTLVRITVSAGVATSTGCATSPTALLAVADAALYRAKQAGRDRVEVAPTASAVAVGQLP